MPGKKSQPAQPPYACSKPGRCCVLATVEPRPGQRLYQVRAQRAYTQFRQQLAAPYPQAKQLRLGQHRLTPHARRTLCDCLPAARAEKLAARLPGYYTPKGGSWLNQREPDCAAWARQCLKRRIPTQAWLAYLLLEPLAPSPGYPNPLARPRQPGAANPPRAVWCSQQGY